MPGKRCPGCPTLIADWQGLCRSCLAQLDKYWEQNPLWVEMYARAGISEFEWWLTPDAERPEPGR